MFSDTISGLVEASDPELDAHIRDLELQRRDVDSKLAAAIAVADTRCLYSVDGYRSMAAYLRGTCNWSQGEVARFTGASKLVNAHPAVGDAWAGGHIGSAQIAVLSKTQSNDRVAHRFAEFVPILLGLWMALAGAFDGFNSVERTGAVIRTRRPAEVSPLPRRMQRVLARDRYRVYLAIDDGSSDTIVAWKTGERHAVPQGARATVVATPALGHISRTSPVGHVLVE